MPTAPCQLTVCEGVTFGVLATDVKMLHVWMPCSYVIKTVDEKDRKVFINVCHSSQVG